MSDTIPPAKNGLPRLLYVANGIELFERFAFYGMYVGLSRYLTNVIGLGDVETGDAMGLMRLVAQLAPIVCGFIADRITFRISLLVAFASYVASYSALTVVRTPSLVVLALLATAVAGGFMKPVIMGTVVRTTKDHERKAGFALFYRMVNLGSVLGKSSAYLVRRSFGLSAVLVNSIVAAAIALGLTVGLFKEPESQSAEPKPTFLTALKGYWVALKNPLFVTALLTLSGFFLMSEQFYFTFPKYLERHISKDAPYEIIGLMNPLVIALFQGRVGELSKRMRPTTAMLLAMLIGAGAMATMGLLPSLWGALIAGAMFATAEMFFAPNYYSYISAFAPEGQAGLYMGLSFVPSGIGAWIGGKLSGRLIERYLPATGPRAPLNMWLIYAAVGAGCAVLLAIYARFVHRAEAQRVG